MKRLFGKTFDFVASIGEDCACAMYLRRHGLRDCSSPMDWVFKASFGMRIDLICSNFAHFMEKDSFRRCDTTGARLADRRNDPYENVETGFWFVHDFPLGVPLDESFPAVKAKYDRRIGRFMRRAASSRNVLFVWWSKDKRILDDQLREARNRIAACFPSTNVHLLAFENDLSAGKTIFADVDERIIRVTGPIVPVAGVTMGDPAVCDPVFARIRRRGMRTDALKRCLAEAFVRVASTFHFSRKKRREARKRLSEKWIGHA